MAIGQFLTFQQDLDEAKAFLRTVPHGDGNCAIQFHHDLQLDTEQPDVERSVRRAGGVRTGSVTENHFSREFRYTSLGPTGN
jgi:hypothetical protein